MLMFILNEPFGTKINCLFINESQFFMRIAESQSVNS